MPSNNCHVRQDPEMLASTPATDELSSKKSRHWQAVLANAIGKQHWQAGIGKREQ